MDYKTTIKVIGFDLDQTLYPKSPEIDEAIQAYIYPFVAKHKNVSLEEAKRLFKESYHVHGLGGTATLKAFGIPDASNIIQEALEKAEIAHFLKPNPELLTLLHELKAKYGTIDIVTGSDRANAEKKLQKINIPLEIFNNVITANNGTKSNGDAYRIWLERYPEFSPNQFLYIGDRAKSDHLVPKELGIASILVYTVDPTAECPQLKNPLELRPLLL